MNQGGASGSTGIQKGGIALRNAAAEARRALVELASQRLGVPADRLEVTDGVVAVTGDSARKLSYGELIGGRYFDLSMTWNGKIGNDLVAQGQAKPKPPNAYKIVGQSPPRFDVPAKVFGQLDYVTDIKVPGMLHGRMIRPPVAGALPVAVDEGSVRDLPGVRVIRDKGFVGVVAEREWHPPVVEKVLPTVAAADVAGARPADRISLPFVHRCQCGAERPLLRPQYPAAMVQNNGRTVAVTSRAEMRREQCVEPQLRITVEPAFDCQHVAANRRANPQSQRIALVLVHDFDGRHTRHRQPHPVIGDALDLGPEALAIGNDEAEVADLRNVNPRVVDLVDDAEAEREPQP